MKKDLNGHLCQLVEELVDRGLTLGQARREFEKQFILAALRSNEGNLSCSARSLGIHRNTLRNKVGDLGISVSDAGGKPRGRARRSSK
ncbi:MAG: helix-turn-helix domain-containing protein [Thermoanaerobaculia bacterium]